MRLLDITGKLLRARSGDNGSALPRVHRASSATPLRNQYSDRLSITMTATGTEAEILALLDQVAGGQELPVTLDVRMPEHDGDRTVTVR